MSKVWFCYEGDRPTLGEAIAERSIDECVELFQLNKNKYLGDDPKNVRFGMPGDPLGTIRGYQHVVVEIEKEEPQANGWKPGYYYSPLSPAEAFEKLGL